MGILRRVLSLSMKRRKVRDIGIGLGRWVEFSSWENW
jgi:hypothetical protein